MPHNLNYDVREESTGISSCNNVTNCNKISAIIFYTGEFWDYALKLGVNETYLVVFSIFNILVMFVVVLYILRYEGVDIVFQGRFFGI